MAIIHLAFADALKDTSRFLINLPVVILSAWYGGVGSGIVTLLFSVVISMVLFAAPLNPIQLDDPFGLLLYGLSGGLVVRFLGAHRSEQQQSEHQQRELVEHQRVDREQSQLLTRADQARETAETANVMKSQYVAMVAHELRTPLTPIIGYVSSLLATDVSWTEVEKRDFLTTIGEEAGSMNNLIDQLLDLAQIQTGHLNIHLQTFSLDATMSFAMVELEALTVNHRLLIDVPQNLPAIMADPQRLAQVMVNLVGNAAKYSPKNTTITISATQQPDGLQVDVQDEGPGIPLPQQRIVFEAFRQLEDMTWPSQKGSGLGLAICKGLIEAHGGHIWIDDKRHSGTLISFSLPTINNNVN